MKIRIIRMVVIFYRDTSNLEGVVTIFSSFFRFENTFASMILSLLLLRHIDSKLTSSEKVLPSSDLIGLSLISKTLNCFKFENASGSNSIFFKSLFDIILRLWIVGKDPLNISLSNLEILLYQISNSMRLGKFCWLTSFWRWATSLFETTNLLISLYKYWINSKFNEQS